MSFNDRRQFNIVSAVEEEAPPDRIPKRRKRKASAAADATVRDFGPGAKLFGRYTLSRILGRGGMGIVWLAEDDQLDRHVALKFLSQQIVHDHCVLADLKRETKRSLELTHPNIVRIHDFVQDARSACISMEFVDGDTLSNLRLRKSNQVFEVPDLEPLVAQWCEAMHYAHVHARVVHCDLKPANLMLSGKGLLKITDFGIARSLSESASRLTASRSTSGTLVYMSPQQLNGDAASVSDDIYSMGASLYELLTGKPPFYRGQIDLQIFDRIPPSIAMRRDELGVKSPFIIPLQWEDTIAACLSKEPIDRPQRVLALLKGLNLTFPLRLEPPRTASKIEQTIERPIVPGTFGLMQDQQTVTLPSAPVAERSFPSGPKLPSIPRDNPVAAKVSEPPSNAERSANVTQSPEAPRAKLSDPIYASRRRYLIVVLLGLVVPLIFGLWYAFSSHLRTLRTSSEPSSTPLASSPMPTDKSPHVDEQSTLPKPAPKVSASLSPKEESRAALEPVASTTPAVLPANEEKPAPVPKDDVTRFHNEVAAAERAILSPQEKNTVQNRLIAMTPDGRTSYEKAITALEEGYPNTAQSFMFELERAEGKNPLTSYLQGLILLSQGKLDEAEAALAKAATLDPDFREVEYHLASVAFKKKDYTRARKRFEHLSFIVASPTEVLKRLLQYRIYLGFLLDGEADSAQQVLQNMQANAETPAFYYAHAAWEFRRNDGTTAKQWLDSASFQYSHDLNLLFLEPLYDLEWLNPLSNIESTSLPSAAPSPTPRPTAALQALSLTDVAVSENKEDASAAVHLSLRIGVVSKPGTPNGRSIEIRVSFFDLTSTGQTVPTDARTSYRWGTLNRNWSEPTTKYLVASYVRPKKSAGATTGRKYGGFIIRLYFDGHFQDERATPNSLLKAFPTDKQAMLTPSVAPSASPQSVETSLSATPATSISPSATGGLTSPGTGQSDSVNEISALEDKWAVGLLLHDAEAVQSLLADTYEAVTPTGRKLNKAQAVQRISEDTDKYDLVDVEKINVRTENATAAVATGVLRQRGKLSNGKAFERAYLFTDDWIKSDGKWLCARSRTERQPKH